MTGSLDWFEYRAGCSWDGESGRRSVAVRRRKWVDLMGAKHEYIPVLLYISAFRIRFPREYPLFRRLSRSGNLAGFSSIWSCGDAWRRDVVRRDANWQRVRVRLNLEYPDWRRQW